MTCGSGQGNASADSSGRRLKLIVGHTFRGWKEQIDAELL